MTNNAKRIIITELKSKYTVTELCEYLGIKRDVYFYKPTTSGNVTLPLKGYEDGKYCSKNGMSCTCHDWCDCDSYADPDCNCFNAYNMNTALRKSTQCDGFARYVYYMVHKENVPGYGDFEKEEVHLTKSNLYYHLEEIGKNSYVRGRTSGGYGHTVFIVSYTTTTVTIYHANYDWTGQKRRCIVEFKELSYDEFLKRLNYYSAVYKAP